MTQAEIDRRFDLHKPATREQELALDVIRQHYKKLAQVIQNYCTETREKALAFTALEESLFWAIGSVVRPTIDARKG